jgi:hypothetical protein
MQLPVKSSELVSVFTEASMNLEFIFLNNLDVKNLTTIDAYTESTDFIFRTLKKKYTPRDTVPLTPFPAVLR